jgi:hypothetical protein
MDCPVFDVPSFSPRGSDESGDCLSPGPECASEAAIVIACFDAVGESGASACCDEVATLESCFGGVCGVCV